MEDISPHLPRKTCDVKGHKTFQTLTWLLFLIFIAGLSSITMTLATLVWFVPTFIPDQLVTTIQKGSQSQKEDLDMNVLNNAKKRLWYIYDKRQKIDEQYYTDTTNKLQAVMFSSDGWAVVYAPEYYKGTEKFWEGVDYQGSRYAIEKVFVDPISKFTYVKFARDGFSFISFANWNNNGEGSVVWELSANTRKQHILGKAVNVSDKQKYAIWTNQFFYNLADAVPGNLIINENGEMIGLIDANNNLIYGWMVDSQYGSILQNGIPNYYAVAWIGYMVHGFTKDQDLTKRISGFYVEGSPTRVTSSTVGIGDLVMRIQNRLVEAETVSRQLLFAPEQFSVTVLRNSKEYEIIINKLNVGK